MKALIDGDELVMKVAFGGQHTYYDIYNSYGLLYPSIPSHKEAQEIINKEEEEDLYLVPKVVYLSEKIVKKAFSYSLQGILKKVDLSNYLLLFSSKNNFRFDLATIQEYKGNRDPAAKPKHFNMIKDYAKSNFKYHEVDGYEADDLLVIHWHDDKESIIVSQDKDLLQVPARFLSMGTEKHKEYAPDGVIFSLDQVEANRNFYRQLLTGDTTDNIPGLYKVTGEKARKKYIDNISELSESSAMYEYVYDCYSNALVNKDNTDDTDLDCILWEIGNLLYLRRSFTDTGWEHP